ncbi:MAG TPA: hypothetical protein VGH85_11180 [Mycobacteriales bacterium]
MASTTDRALTASIAPVDQACRVAGSRPARSIAVCSRACAAGRDSRNATANSSAANSLTDTP